MRDRILALAAWAVMNGMSVSLAIFGFERTARFALERASKRPLSDDTAEESVDRIAQAIGRAKRWHMRMTADDCLPVALTGVWMLRRRRVQADLVLGVTRFPFAAHAWVAAGDRIIDFPANKHTHFIGVNMTRREQRRPC
jgi:hypothetical protein